MMQQVLRERWIPLEKYSIDGLKLMNFLHRPLFFLAIAVVLSMELFWMGRVIYHELATPTLQLQARTFLVQYVSSPKSQRGQLLQIAEDHHIVIWPQQGIEVTQNSEKLIPEVKTFLNLTYPDEFNSLNFSEKTILEDTLQQIQQDVYDRIQRGITLDIETFSDVLFEDSNLLSSFVMEYVGLNRYRWLSFDKTLYYTIHLQRSDETYRIYFASVSDAAEKLFFLTKLLPPGLLFFVSTLLILVLGFYAYQIQERNNKEQLEQQIQDRTVELKQANEQLQLDIIERQRMEDFEKKRTKQFSKFVPHEFLEQLDKKNILDLQLGNQVNKKMSILFADIRSFTSLSEKMTPEENFRFLNSYFSYVGPAIREHHGFIDKYIGDSIMALFPKDADDALQAAISLLRLLDEYNSGRTNAGYPSIKIGIGVNSGPMMLGTIGEANRMEGTVIGDAVNLASRIESLTKIYGAPILISNNTFLELNHPEDYHIRFVDRVQVKGKEEFVVVYEVFDNDPPEIREGKRETTMDFEKAWHCYQMGNYDEALQLFKICHERIPEDHVTELYLERCQKKIEEK